LINRLYIRRNITPKTTEYPVLFPADTTFEKQHIQKIPGNSTPPGIQLPLL